MQANRKKNFRFSPNISKSVFQRSFQPFLSADCGTTFRVLFPGGMKNTKQIRCKGTTFLRNMQIYLYILAIILRGIKK